MFKNRQPRGLLILSVLLAHTIPCLAAPYESVSYLYGGTSPIYENNITRTRGNLTMVMPDYFHIDANGSAALSKQPDILFIQARQREGIRVVPFVSNHWDREAGRKAMGKRAAVAAALAGWVDQYGLDGLDVDIENLTEADRDSFTDFLRILRQLLPPGKYLSVAAAANPHRLSTGWHGQYDYARLAGYCDAVFIMTYDQSYEGSAAGPVASHAFTESSVKEALRHIPRQKLLMGIPFYGRYWAALDNGGRVAGKAFTVSDVEALTAHHASSMWYDDVNHCARATMTVKSADPVLGLWGGKRLEPGVYDIWYENDRSYAARMELCRKYGLAGVASWALGQEPQRIWDSYRLWLHGLPFTDITGHWAEEGITGLYDEGLVTGTGGGQFLPGKALTRAETVVLMCKWLGIPESDPSNMPDEIRRHWAAPWLTSAIRCELMTGDGMSYRPGALITRAELAALCAKGLNAPNTIDFSQRFFPDVSPPMWFNNAVVTMRVYGLINGAPDGLFHPAKGASRAEAAMLIWNMFDMERKPFAPAPGSNTRRFRGHAPPPVLEPR